MIERTIIIPAGTERTAVLGSADRNIKMIREIFGVTIGARNGEVIIRGDEPAVAKAIAVLEYLSKRASRNHALGRDDVLQAIMNSPDVPRYDETLHESHAPAWEGPLNVNASGQPVRAKTPNQEQYLEAIRTHDLVVAIGPAGTGKTYLSVAAALHMLRIGRVKRIVLARPAVEAGERLGFLPGDLQEKVNPYLRPLFDALEDMLDFGTLQRFITTNVIEVIPLAFMRGRTLNDAIMILDEAQNTTRSQMLMFLTRMGRRSKSIVTGDVTQIDLPNPAESGLTDAVRRLRRVRGATFVALDRGDIVRHDIVNRIVHAYGAEPGQSRGPDAEETEVLQREIRDLAQNEATNEPGAVESDESRKLETRIETPGTIRDQADVMQEG